MTPEKNILEGNRRDSQWRLVKEVPLAVIIILVGIALTNIIAYFVFQDRMEIYIEVRDEQFEQYMVRTDKRFEAVYKTIAEKTKDRVHRTEVASELDKITSEFRIRDVQINNLTSVQMDIKKGVTDLSALMHKLREDVMKMVVTINNGNRTH